MESGSNLCFGLQGACEAAYAAIYEQIIDGNCDLIIDTKSDYNLVDRTKTLRTAHSYVPEIYQCSLNFHGSTTRDFYFKK